MPVNGIHQNFFSCGKALLDPFAYPLPQVCCSSKISCENRDISWKTFTCALCFFTAFVQIAKLIGISLSFYREFTVQNEEQKTRQLIQKLREMNSKNKFLSQELNRAVNLKVNKTCDPLSKYFNSQRITSLEEEISQATKKIRELEKEGLRKNTLLKHLSKKVHSYQKSLTEKDRKIQSYEHKMEKLAETSRYFQKINSQLTSQLSTQSAILDELYSMIVRLSGHFSHKSENEIKKHLVELRNLDS